MALDFPNAPTNGQSFTAPNGVIWTWDGVKWVNGTGVATYAPIGSPAFTGDPTAPTPAYGDNDTSVATTAFVQAAVAPMTHNVGRNLMHNPLFNIAQRGGGPWTTFGAYTLDRWVTGGATDAVSFAQQPLVDSYRAQLGDEEASFALSNTFTGNAAAGACSYIAQKIENIRRLAGKTVTVSFYALCGSGTPRLGVNFFQVFGSGGSPSAQVTMNGQAVTISTVFTRYSLTFTLPSISGKVVGTNNDHYTMLNIWYSSGATNNTAAGNIGVQSGTFWLWGVQLEIGSVATPLEKPDPQQDLAKCQRFYQVGYASIVGLNNAGVSTGYTMSFPVTMRAAPTITPTFTSQINCSGSSITPWDAGSAEVLTNANATGGFILRGSYVASADL